MLLVQRTCDLADLNLGSTMCRCRGMLRVVKLPGMGALAAPHPEVDLLLVRCAAIVS